MASLNKERQRIYNRKRGFDKIEIDGEKEIIRVMPRRLQESRTRVRQTAKLIPKIRVQLKRYLDEVNFLSTEFFPLLITDIIRIAEIIYVYPMGKTNNGVYCLCRFDELGNICVYIFFSQNGEIYLLTEEIGRICPESITLKNDEIRIRFWNVAKQYIH